MSPNSAAGEKISFMSDEGDDEMWDTVASSELMYEEGAAMGDPRRCPHHPHIKTSSNDGMFDAPCDECEHADDQRAAEWEVSPENTTRTLCELTAYIPRGEERSIAMEDAMAGVVF